MLIKKDFSTSFFLVTFQISELKFWFVKRQIVAKKKKRKENQQNYETYALYIFLFIIDLN